MRLVLVRHAESAGNASRRIQGHLDLGLSDAGREQAARLASRLARLGAGALYTSPLLRAKETAELALATLHLPIDERPALMERDVGDLSGLTGDEAIERFPGIVEARRNGGLHTLVPGYEPEDDFRRRVIDELDALIERHPEGAVVAVTHGGVIGAFLRHTLGLSGDRPGGFTIDNTSVTTFDVAAPDFDANRRPRLRLVSLNDTCHLQ